MCPNASGVATIGLPVFFMNHTAGWWPRVIPPGRVSHRVRVTPSRCAYGSLCLLAAVGYAPTCGCRLRLLRVVSPPSPVCLGR